MHFHDKKIVQIIGDELRKNNISRRDAIKLTTLGSASFLFSPTQVLASNEELENIKINIVIVGGGLAGISTAAKLKANLANSKITVIEPNESSVLYQPGLTLVGSGVWNIEDIDYKTTKYIPKNIDWIKDYAIEFDPDNNTLTTKSGTKITYDFLVIATGLKLDYSRIKGLEELGELYSTVGANSVGEFFERHDIASIYQKNGAINTWSSMQKFVAKASNGNKVNGIFTDPATPTKCGGAPKKIMYLTYARLKEANATQNATLTFNPNSSKMFAIKDYNDAILNQFEARGFKYNFSHNLISIDLAKKVATFENSYEEKGPWDADLEEYTTIKKTKSVEFGYDFIHITPPQKAPDEIASSPLGSAKGWVPVDKETLCHVKYKNVFALGDVVATSYGKTGGSARKQYKVVAQNIINRALGKELSAKYNGYTVCPFITDIGKVMMAEFDYTDKMAPSFPLDATQERWIWWLLKVYILKPMTMNGMLKGRV